MRPAQAEYEGHQPEDIVGPSRGGAVAMSLASRNTPLVWLCPAWSCWGTAKSVKRNTVILTPGLIPWGRLRIARNRSETAVYPPWLWSKWATITAWPTRSLWRRC